jgi:hypothetical protein
MGTEEGMSKHTPGPWAWGANYDGLYGAGPDNDVLTHQSYENMWLAYKRTAGEREANARLIAAAPELLEALQAMLDDAVVLSAKYLETFRDWAPDATIQGWDKARWLRALAASDRAHAAIAKATEITPAITTLQRDE